MFYKKITVSSSVFKLRFLEALFPFEFLGKMYITAKLALKICLIWKTASVQMYLKGVSKGLWGCVDAVFPSQPPLPPPTLPQTYTQNPGYSKNPPTKK